ncbi:unnamed protein product [Prunus brigantina]
MRFLLPCSSKSYLLSPPPPRPRLLGTNSTNSMPARLDLKSWASRSASLSCDATPNLVSKPKLMNSLLLISLSLMTILLSTSLMASVQSSKKFQPLFVLVIPISIFQSRTSQQPNKSIHPSHHSGPRYSRDSADANSSDSNFSNCSYSGRSNSRRSTNFSSTGYRGFCQLWDQQGHSTKRCPRVQLAQNHQPMANPTTSSRTSPSPTWLLGSLTPVPPIM